MKKIMLEVSVYSTRYCVHVYVDGNDVEDYVCLKELSIESFKEMRKDYFRLFPNMTRFDVQVYECHEVYVDAGMYSNPHKMFEISKLKQNFNINSK
jgi:hypothetical protein